MGVNSVLQEFKRILLEEYSFVGTIQQINEQEGTSIVSTPAGGTMKVKGNNYQSGDKVLVKNGVIISKAPSVSYYEFEI